MEHREDEQDPRVVEQYRPQFIGHLHAFRGVAIMLIVLVHIAGYSMFRIGTDPDMSDYLVVWAVFETIAHNGTVFFALISGLLYSTVLAGRGWVNFFRSKVTNVILPYVFFSLLFTAIVFSGISGISLFSGEVADYAREAFGNILTGNASFHFWYLPVLAGLFVLTPLVASIVAKPWGGWIVGAAMLVPLFVSRTWPDNSVQNVAVFMAPYAFGVWLGADYDSRMEKLRLLMKPLIATVILLSVATTAAFVQYTGPMYMADEQWDGPVNWYESISYVQKMALACVVLLVLKANESWRPRWLDLLATYAFAIYFLHAAVRDVLFEGLLWLGVEIGPSWLHAPTILIIWIATLALSLGFSMLVRRALGRRSRMIIGA